MATTGIRGRSGRWEHMWIWASVFAAAVAGCEASGALVVEDEDPAEVEVAGVEVSPGSAALEVLASRAFSATVRGTDDSVLTDRLVVWSVVDTEVATTNQSGTVTGVAAGETFLVAEVEGLADSARVTITEEPPVEVASVEISPGSVAIEVEESQAFSAAVRGSDDSVLTDRLVVWSVVDTDVATTNQNGTVTGVAAGETFLVADVEGVADSARVTVTAAPPVEVASVEVSPGSAEIEVEESQAFSATVRGTDDSVLTDRLVVWSVVDTDVATTDQNGTVTGVAEGETFLVADVEGVADSARITITDNSVPPGVTIYVQEGFENGQLASRGWYDNTNLTLTTAEHRQGTSALEVRFPAGADVPTFGGSARIRFEDTETVYLSYWVKYSDNWVGSGQNFHPHEFQFLTNLDDPYVGPASTRLTTYVEHNYRGGIVPVLAMQDASNIDQSRINVDLTGVTEARAAGGCNGAGDAHASAMTCYPSGSQYRNGKTWYAAGPVLTHGGGARDINEWHFVEAYFELNSIQGGIGQADGVARYWLDGELVLDVQNILFRTGQHPNMAFRTLLVAPYIGAGSPVTQTAWVDDLRVANRRP